MIKSIDDKTNIYLQLDEANNESLQEMQELVNLKSHLG